MSMNGRNTKCCPSKFQGDFKNPFQELKDPTVRILSAAELGSDRSRAGNLKSDEVEKTQIRYALIVL